MKYFASSFVYFVRLWSCLNNLLRPQTPSFYAWWLSRLLPRVGRYPYRNFYQTCPFRFVYFAFWTETFSLEPREATRDKRGEGARQYETIPTDNTFLCTLHLKKPISFGRLHIFTNPSRQYSGVLLPILYQTIPIQKISFFKKKIIKKFKI